MSAHVTPLESAAIAETALGLLSLDQCSAAYEEHFPRFARSVPSYTHEVLRQLVNGPVWDGDVISKSYRDDLIDWKLAVRICAKGEQGYTAATYLGFSVLKFLGEL